MTVSQRSSVESRRKPEKVNVLVAGKDVPFTSPRPGGYVDIPKKKIPPPPPPVVVSCSAPEDLHDPACICKSPSCRENKPCPTIAVQPPSLENSIAGMHSFALPGAETTREFRIHKALTSDWEVSSYGGDFAESEEDLISQSDRPAVNLLITTISTIMLLASDNSVPDDILEAVEAYLKCITDDEDNVPPNIQGLLNHIALLKGKEGSAHPSKECVTADGTGSVVVLTSSKMSKKSATEA